MASTPRKIFGWRKQRTC